MLIEFMRASLVAAALLWLAPASAAEIILDQSAVQTLVVDSLFRDNGRYYIQRGACSAYLDSPTVALSGGRVVIRSRLNGRLGLDFGDSCAGVDLVSWTTISGVPSAQGNSVRLSDIRLDEVGDSNTRIVLNSGLIPALPSALELDVSKAVRSMFQTSGSRLQVDVLELEIQAVRVTQSKLFVRFDFKVEVH